MDECGWVGVFFRLFPCFPEIRRLRKRGERGYNSLLIKGLFYIKKNYEKNVLKTPLYYYYARFLFVLIQKFFLSRGDGSYIYWKKRMKMGHFFFSSYFFLSPFFVVVLRNY